MAIHERGVGSAQTPLAVIARFLAVGAFNTILTFVLYQILILLLSYRLAYTFSFATGIAVAAMANAKFVFCVPIVWTRSVLVAIFYLANYGIGLGLLTAIVHGGVSIRLAPLFAIPLMLPLNFIGSRMILGRRRRLPLTTAREH
jgi:putative flippase GtrA